MNERLVQKIHNNNSLRKCIFSIVQFNHMLTDMHNKHFHTKTITAKEPERILRIINHNQVVKWIRPIAMGESPGSNPTFKKKYIIDKVVFTSPCNEFISVTLLITLNHTQHVIP